MLSATDLEEIVALPEPERQTDVADDGFVYDVETGEVLGLADLKPEFKIDSTEAADWALELRSRLEGDIAGINARIKALNDQLGALKREKQRRLSWWDFRFAKELEAFGRRLIEGKRTKTAKFAWGSVSFRATRGSNQILAMDKAVEFVKAWLPDRVKVEESVGVTDVLAAREKAAEVTGEKMAGELPFMISTGAGENVTISTGINLKGDDKR